MKFNYLSHVWWHVTMTQLVAESGESCFWDQSKIYSRILSWKIKIKSLNFLTTEYIKFFFFFSVWIVEEVNNIWLYYFTLLFIFHLSIGNTFIASTSWPLWILLRIWICIYYISVLFAWCILIIHDNCSVFFVLFINRVSFQIQMLSCPRYRKPGVG